MRFFVPGIPAPQGSKRHVGRGVMVESSKRLKPWREDVRQGALDAAIEQQWTAPEAVAIGLTFWMPRPKSHPKTRRTIHSSRPDLDKTIRGVFDALTSAGAIRDDSNVVKVSAVMAYVHPEHLRYEGERDRPGVDIFIRHARDMEAADV